MQFSTSLLFLIAALTTNVAVNYIIIILIQIKLLISARLYATLTTTAVSTVQCHAKAKVLEAGAMRVLEATTERALNGRPTKLMERSFPGVMVPIVARSRRERVVVATRGFWSCGGGRILKDEDFAVLGYDPFSFSNDVKCLVMRLSATS